MSISALDAFAILKNVPQEEKTAAAPKKKKSLVRGLIGGAVGGGLAQFLGEQLQKTAPPGLLAGKGKARGIAGLLKGAPGRAGGAYLMARLLGGHELAAIPAGLAMTPEVMQELGRQPAIAGLRKQISGGTGAVQRGLLKGLKQLRSGR
jgi:hypothetical protein